MSMSRVACKIILGETTLIALFLFDVRLIFEFYTTVWLLYPQSPFSFYYKTILQGSLINYLVEIFRALNIDISYLYIVVPQAILITLVQVLIIQLITQILEIVRNAYQEMVPRYAQVPTLFQNNLH